MINRLIEWSVNHRLAVIGLTLLLVAAGLRALWTTPVDAIPDLSENQVLVCADWPGRSPQEVEDEVTYPLSAHLQGIAGVKTVRASSMFGFSLATVIFGDEIKAETARQRVLEKLNLIGAILPDGVQARLGPDATGLGWVYQYYLEVDPARSPKGGYDLGELRALQDSFIRLQLSSVPGVAEVAGVGGFAKQYQIEIDSARLRAAGISLSQVMQAVAQNNLNVGGKTIEENGMEFVLRGVGLAQDTSDLGSTVLVERQGTPIFLKDVARVEVGGDFRRGTLDVNGHETVGGTVVMRSGENAREVIRRVKARLEQIQTSLPAGITLKPFYDRSELIDRTLGTLKSALFEELLLVVLAHILFLWHFRSILIVTLPLPISVLVSFILMRQLGISSNLMSLAGIAIAIGVLVDAAIVMTDNVLRHCEKAEREMETSILVLTAAKQVGRPIFFAMGIIILAFLPVFALSGQEGKLFHPLAFTKTFAMIGAAVLAVTVVPVLCTLFVRGPFRPEERNFLMGLLRRGYEPALDWALRHRNAVLSLAGGTLVLALILAFGLPRSLNAPLAGLPRVQRWTRGLGREFMPPLNEGSLLFMPTFVPATALSEVQRVMAWQDRVFKSIPEVKSAAGKLGRGDTATDPAPTEMIETTIVLKPETEWRPGVTRQSLLNEMTEKLRQVPGSVPGFLQPIQGRILMISTGVRAQLGVKLLGDNQAELQKWAFEAEKIVREVEGANGVAASRVQGKPYFEIAVNRQAMARYGLRAQDVLDIVESGLGGKNVTTLIEGRNRFPVQVRLQRSEREDLERLRDVLVTSTSGKVVPLGQVATLTRVEGPNEIASENGRLRVFVQANVDSQVRDLGSFVDEVKARIQRELVPRLPAGIMVEYSGEYENQLHAARTLRFVVPGVLLVIFLLLCRMYRSIQEAAHVLLAVPFALSGGLLLQFLLGYPFSVAVWVGYIALFGTAIQTGVVMVVYLQEAVARRRKLCGAAFGTADLLEAVKEGARLRLRPKVMTVATIVASLLPVLWSTRPGSEVMRPLAVPVIGGMVSSLVHVLIVTPVIFCWLHKRELQPRSAGKRTECWSDGVMGSQDQTVLATT